MQTLRKTISLLCFVVLLLTNVTAVPEYVELSRGIRLRDGHSEGVGRVEVLHAGEWGTVCNEGWDMVDAYVACRQLGFPGVLNSYTAIDGVGPVWLARVACKGTESAVSQCRHSPWGRTQCLRRNDVGVSCRRGTDPNYLEEVDECGPYPQVHNFAVRLVGKRPYRGKVEVRVGELWQPICADQWGGKDAMVLCGQLGYSRGYAKVHAQKSTLQLQGVSTNFSCDGTESFLQTCKHAGFGTYSCKRPAYAAVRCIPQSRPRENGVVRLRGGAYPWQGRVEVYNNGMWRKVCDHEWDIRDASVVCRQVGYGSAYEAVYRARDYFGQGFTPVLLNEVGCHGNEESLLDCDHSPPGSCSHTENAGVRCHSPLSSRDKGVRLVGGTRGHGRVEVLDMESLQWGTICADSWNLSTGMVVCRELGLGFAAETRLSSRYEYTKGELQLMDLSCNGWELSLAECKSGQWESASGATCDSGIAFLTCTCRLPDLIPNFMTVHQSLSGAVHSPLQLVKLANLECAFEEKCLSSTAETYFQSGMKFKQARNENSRTLLRFSVNVLNFGNADFKPFVPRSEWVWHSCHNHFHSFEDFARYDILDRQGREVAEGHKASFCLEDVNCGSGGVKRYSCRLHNQGISVNCYDSYAYDIDCQWIDITDVPHGNYTLVVSVNPEQRRAEMDVTNNKVICNFEYRSDTIFFLTGKVDNVNCRLSG